MIKPSAIRQYAAHASLFAPDRDCTQKLHRPDPGQHNLGQRSCISTNTTPPSSQGWASLKNSLTGRRLCTVSLAIRQPLGPGFFAREFDFPPLPPGLTEADVFAEADGLAEASRLTAALIPALALFLFRPTADLAAGLAADLAAEDLAAEDLAAEGLATEEPAPDLEVDTGRAADPVVAVDRLADLEAAALLRTAPDLAVDVLAPDRAAMPGRASGQRPLRRCAALRAEAVRVAGLRRSGGVPGPPAIWPRISAMAAVTSSIEAMPSTILSTPFPA